MKFIGQIALKIASSMQHVKIRKTWIPNRSEYPVGPQLERGFKKKQILHKYRFYTYIKLSNSCELNSFANINAFGDPSNFKASSIFCKSRIVEDVGSILYKWPREN